MIAFESYLSKENFSRTGTFLKSESEIILLFKKMN